MCSCGKYLISLKSFEAGRADHPMKPFSPASGQACALRSPFLCLRHRRVSETWESVRNVDYGNLFSKAFGGTVRLEFRSVKAFRFNYTVCLIANYFI